MDESKQKEMINLRNLSSRLQGSICKEDNHRTLKNEKEKMASTFLSVQAEKFLPNEVMTPHTRT